MEDGKIIDLFWQRSERAIQETKMKYERMCLHIAMNILHNREDSEECTNDTYLGLWNSIPEERPAYFGAFICKIIRNISLNRLKYSLAGKRHGEVQMVYEELEAIADTRDYLWESLEEQELVAMMNEFLQKLSREKRNIFIRRYFFFDTVADIARMYEFSESKVKSILSRDGRKLQLFLQERGY